MSQHQNLQVNVIGDILNAHENMKTKYVKVRYAFTDAPSCAIYSNGLPSGPFMINIKFPRTTFLLYPLA